MNINLTKFKKINNLPKKGEKIVVAMSGGVDSSVTAAILNYAGYEVIGVSMKLYEASKVSSPKTCCSGVDIRDAREVAKKLGIKHYIVDYKSTHTENFERLKNFDAPYLIGYKRQAEIYAWILSKLGLDIHQTSYFLYVNATLEEETFNNKLDFEYALIPYEMRDFNWVEDTIIEIKNFLETNKIPAATNDCELCKYMHKFFEFIKKKN